MIFQLLRAFIISISCLLLSWQAFADSSNPASPSSLSTSTPNSVAPVRQSTVTAQNPPVKRLEVPNQSASANLSKFALKAAEQIMVGGQIDSLVRSNLENSADGLFMLGWLYEFGGYGFSVNAGLAYEYYQRAAEQGQMDAAHYCWQRCLSMTPMWLAAMKSAAGGNGVDRNATSNNGNATSNNGNATSNNGNAASNNGNAASNNAQGLYLYSKWLVRQGGRALPLADKKLLSAAKLRQPQAINELYIQHFLQWSKSKRSFPEALKKLNRCADEGVVSCYLLLGSLYQRHGFAQEALLNYLLLQQLDYGLFRNYLSASKLTELEKRLPKDSLPVVLSRAATRLSTHPRTGFDAIDRFMVCSPNATYACIRKMVKRDPACMLSYFAESYFEGLRETDAYQNCMARYGAD